MRTKLFTILSFSFCSFYSFESISCVQMCQEPYCNTNSAQVRLSFSGNSTKSNGRKFAPNTNLELLNIKAKAIERIKLAANASSGKKMLGNNAIVITREDVEKISAPRNTWLTFFGITESIPMDIGTADMVNAQNWTLPAGLLDSFEFYYNDDFIPVEEVPQDLTFPNANKVIKSEYLDPEDNIINLYEHYEISYDSVTFIGSSYYYYLDEDEDAIDFTDFKFADIPMSLGDSYDFREDDTGQNRGLRYYIRTKTVDAFGTLQTPYGDLECLRISISTDQYTRPDSSSAFTMDATFYAVGFVTKDGLYFNGITDGVSGSVNIQNVELKVVAPTGILSPPSDVQINNDGDGILISNTGVYIDVLTKTADKDAIMDIESDDKGIMIPRLSQADRPVSPNEGLLIYQYDNSPGFYYYDGESWTRMDNTTVDPSARVAARNQTKDPSKSIYKRGFGKLVNGSAFVHFKTNENINPEDLLIQLQAEGECKGLYISKKTSDGFEVKELNNGKSNVRFSWLLNQ